MTIIVETQMKLIEDELTLLTAQCGAEPPEDSFNYAQGAIQALRWILLGSGMTKPSAVVFNLNATDS